MIADALGAVLERHDITKADWTLYRDTPIWIEAETGADVIRSEDIWRASEPR